MASSSSLLPLSLSLWVDGNHFSTPSEDSALRPFRKLREEQNLFFSRFSEDAIDAIDARAARQPKQDQMMKALRQGRRRRTGRENVYLWQRRPHPPQRLQCHPHLFEKELLAVDRETIDKEVNAGGLRASLNAGMALVRRWIRSRSATHLLHGTTHSWTTSSSPLQYRHKDGNIQILEDDDLIDFSSQNSSTSTIVDDFATSQQHPQLRSSLRIAPPMIIKPPIQWDTS